MVSMVIGNWFKENRENYQWPEGVDRLNSEYGINVLASEVKAALDSNDVKALQDSLVSIHLWKTNNILGQTDKYQEYLESLGMIASKREIKRKIQETGNTPKQMQWIYTEKLLKKSSFNGIDRLEEVIRYLKVRHCNLPACSAIASFLYGRLDVPVVDRFIAQFFAKEIHKNDISAGTHEVLYWITNIPFKLEDDGRGKGRLRLAVYTSRGFDYNLKQYHQLVSECSDIADALNANGYSYDDINGFRQEFTPIDVDMAIFSWATKNRSLFDHIR